MEPIISCCSGASSSAKTSAPWPLLKRRKTIAIFCLSSSPSSVRNSAMSNSFMSSSSFWRDLSRRLSKSSSSFSRRCS